MFTDTIQLLNRLADNYQEQREWFRAIREWYEDINLAQGIIEELLAVPEFDLLTVSVNDRVPSYLMERDGRRILVRISSESWQEGENRIVVGLKDESAESFCVDAVWAGQPRTGVRQRIDMTGSAPNPEPAFQFLAASDAEARRGYWEMQPKGLLLFRLFLHTPGSVVLGLQMPRDFRFPLSKRKNARQSKLLKELYERVFKELKKRIDELSQARRRTADPEARSEMSRQLDDLEAYLELHVGQLRSAVADGGRLRDSIERTGNPDRLIAKYVRSTPRVPDLPEAVPMPPEPRPAGRSNRGARRSPTRRPPTSVPASSGFLGKFIFTLFLAALTAGIVAVWQFDGLNWIQQKFDEWSNKPGGRGDVLVALRETGTDLKWKNEACQEVRREQLQNNELLKGLAEAFKIDQQGPAGMDQVKIYILGDRKDAMAEALFGFPLCEQMVVLYDLRTAAEAKTMFGRIQGRNAEQARLNNVPIQIQQVTVADCEQGFRIATGQGALAAQQTFARQGRFIFTTMGANQMNEQESRLSTLAKRLRRHFGS